MAACSRPGPIRARVLTCWHPEWRTAFGSSKALSRTSRLLRRAIYGRYRATGGASDKAGAARQYYRASWFQIADAGDSDSAAGPGACVVPQHGEALSN